MSATTLGRNLLAEIQEESLDEPLESLRAWKTPTGRHHVGVAALDRLVDVFSKATQQHRRFQTIEEQHEPQLIGPAPPVIELTGLTPSSGKTQLLHHIIANTLLPRTYEGIQLGGKQAAVALLDLSSNYSVSRLGSILENLTSTSLCDGGIPVDERHQFNHDCLQHLHVFRPQTHQSLVATIDNLQQYFLSNTTSHYSANRPLGAIFINDLSAFFWQIRQEAEEIKDAALERPGQEPLDKGIDILSKRYSNLVEALSKAQRVFDCLIIATNSALAAPSRTRDGSSLRSHLPGAWNRFRTFNIVLQRNAVTKFGPGLSVQEVLAEKQQRQEAVDRSGFSGWINWWDSEVWKEDLKTSVRAWGERGGLRYHVAARGVTFEEEG